MKPLAKFLLGSLLLAGLQFASSGCASDGYTSESVYYGSYHRDPWFHDDPWMDNRHWYREEPSQVSVGVYIHPPRHP